MTRRISILAALVAASVLGCQNHKGHTPRDHRAQGGMSHASGGSGTTIGSEGGASLGGDSGGGGSSTTTSSGGVSGEPIAPKCSNPGRTLADCDAQELFDYATVPVFDVTMPSAEWNSLLSHATDEQYAEASLAFEGQSLGTVGLRFKGSQSTLNDCFDGTGKLICPKLSMKVRFDKYVPETRFYGLKRLNFNSMLNDSSHLRERLALGVYRAIGIKAPRSSFANVRVNGQSLGIFAMVEQVDGRFTARNWPDDGDGYVYKEAIFSYPDPSLFSELSEEQRNNYATSVGRFRSDAYFDGRLRTHKDAPNHTVLREFSKQLSSATASLRRKVIEEYMDWNYLVRFLVTADAVLDSNGLFSYYTSLDFSEIGPTNYFLYQQSNIDRFWLIPWDQDGTFNPGNGYNLLPHWSIRPTNCSTLYPIWHGVVYAIAPGCVPLFEAVAEDATLYKKVAEELLNGPLNKDALISQIERDAAFIEAAVKADANGPEFSDHKSAIESVKSSIDIIRRRLTALANRETITPLHFSSDNVTDFEGLRDLDVEIGPMMRTNASSSAHQSVNQTEPLNGSSDLKVSFTYKNETKAFNQWMYFSVPLREGTVDMRGKTGIRLRVRADRQRTIRVDIESPEQSKASEGIRKGWDVHASSTPALVEKLFEQADVPMWVQDRGEDPNDPLEKVLSKVTGLAFNPECRGRDQTGFLPEGTTDSGWVQIDDVEFF